MYSCPRCPQKLNTRNEYLAHMGIHSKSLKNGFPCPYCKIAFQSRKGFYDHIVIHEKVEKEESTPVLCRHCNVSFSSVNEVERHLRTLPQNVNIPCPFCKVPPFKDLNHYNVHRHR